MKKYENLPLDTVKYNDNGNSVELHFFVPELGNVLIMRMSKLKYDESSKTYQPDTDTAQRAEEISHEYFGTDFDSLEETLGTLHDVYYYPEARTPFAKVYPVNFTQKFDLNMVNKTVTGKITEVVDTGTMFLIKFEYEGGQYVTRFKYSTWVQAKKAYFPIVGQREPTLLRFEKKTGMTFEEAKANMPGKEALFTIKKAGANSTWAEFVAIK